MPEEINHDFIYLHKYSLKAHTHTYLCASCILLFDDGFHIKVHHTENNIDSECYICKLPTPLSLHIGGA